MAGGAELLVLLFGLAAPLVLYWLVRPEHEDREVMDRTAAERAARRDLSDEGDDRPRKRDRGRR
ncbi:hypothetical protein ACFR97_08890 [Haloplanus litoreus]|uniref:Sec-independent protein translocase protein TatA n=1 Tax=Haloplanus litoreus TaxID=767515 RepID=A0ABD5ZUG1_9EURY